MIDMQFLNFKDANCKNCYKCLRECPVKAITVLNHQARIMEDKCILCGRCTSVCHQNAKEVASELEKVRGFLAAGEKVVVSVAPSFISNFELKNFEGLKQSLLQAGFVFAEETARGANAVVNEYRKQLESGKYKNLIASACPSIVRLIEMYYPKALKYLSMVDSPMVAHAKILRREFGQEVKIVFLGPCIAKKREAYESGIIDAVLTFEELQEFFLEKGIVVVDLPEPAAEKGNRAKYFPINRGIIKSFPYFPKNYEYISIDGVGRCMEVLENIETLSGVFFEMNTCEFSCINGPCVIHKDNGGFIKATESVRSYVREELKREPAACDELDYSANYRPLHKENRQPSEAEIREILAKTGKTSPEHELNCGACGYNTCREKAWAVYNGLAELEMCVPYMRERAESMSYEIIKNSPNGILAVDSDLKIVDYNSKAKELLGIKDDDIKGRYLVEYYNPVDFFSVLSDGRNVLNKKISIESTGRYADLSITYLKDQKMMFGIFKDITSDENYRKIIHQVKQETIDITDKVVEKQMRVVQEIASLLGETTAETKVALVKLKNTLLSEDQEK